MYFANKYWTLGVSFHLEFLEQGGFWLGPWFDRCFFSLLRSWCRICTGFDYQTTLCKKYTTTKIVIFSLVVGSLTLFGFGSIKTAWLVFALIPIAVLTELMNPTLDGFISNKVSDDTQGLLQGILSSINAITTILSPLLMTLLFKIGASQKDDWYVPGLPFYFAAILLIICIIPILKVMNTLEHAKKRKIK